MKQSGWLEVNNVETRGDPALANACAYALTRTGRVERLTHGFHTYPAGLHPETVQTLLELCPGQTLLDPFCGGGTTLIEGLVAGREVIGTDLSPVAVLVATGRTLLWSTEDVSRMRGAARRITESAKGWQDLPRDPAVLGIRSWYEEHVGRELEGIRRGIELAPNELQAALRLCFSSILVKCSLRRSDTSAERVVKHRAPETTAILFHKKAREYGRKLEELRAACPPEARSAVLLGDCRENRLSGTVDAIVTSPPYPGVYDYLPLQRLRLAWLGLGSDRRTEEVGPRRAFKADRRDALNRWRGDMTAWLKTANRQLVDGGRIAIVIGDGFSGRQPLDSLAPMESAAAAAGFRSLARASGARADEGPGVKRLEHVMLFEKS